ncbi:hypothetical protein CDG76_35155 [Nostoc sp. 'Peltigera membranacea cyanobiont' 210A]|uniref:aldose epimerase family protein n=1 Tax=Nostoc sp. 'Peltigera membranacea cyanobiont' 210A TaxID=2014529 RepID=UPI000B957663|nr:aldose epimerase family protein [Nostoc sp. 'Peltigera membranacea cyanobiont' 210A]OYD89384.1 hypothetical protein CDG76_35155 [Nostoc sp. 'Peltigera membranacea cyanobiont' 210A]
MQIEHHTIGTTIRHAAQAPRTVDAYTLSDGDGISVKVWTYGASLIEVRLPDGRGGDVNVVVRLPQLADYERVEGRAYLGATMGRYARCISGGCFTLDGREYQLVRNNGAHHIHGGRLGFDAFVWEARTECTNDWCAVELRLVRPDGDQGYPGEITAMTTYRLGPGPTLMFEHRARTSSPTVCDITNHAMWNLAGTGTIDRHLLQVNTNRLLHVDDQLMPIGEPMPIDGTTYDLREGKPLAGLSLDNCYLLNSSRDQAALLSDPASGRSMRIQTDQPGLQIYTADTFIYPRTGICLQTGSWPNAPVRPDFPSAYLAPGEEYLHRTIHRFHGPGIASQG